MYTYVLISLGFSSQQPVLFFFYQTLKINLMENKNLLALEYKLKCTPISDASRPTHFMWDDVILRPAWRDFIASTPIRIVKN